MASFCTSCAATLDPGSKFCGACGATVEEAPQISAGKADRAPQVFSHGHGDRYPALRIIAVILKVLAVLTALGGLLGGIAFGSIPASSYFPTGSGTISLLAIFGGLLAGLCYALFLWASAEMINVVLDIEENTRRAAA